MPWQWLLPFLINETVGVALVNGDSVSGKLCRFDYRGIYLLQHVSGSQFTTRFYLYGQIQNITAFPSCYPIPALY